MIDEKLKKEINDMLENMHTVKETLEVCEKITKILNGTPASIAIPVTGVVMAKVLMGCCESKQEALATLAINMSKTYEMIMMLYDTAEEEAEESLIQ
jgi:hypothetical protein